MEQQEYIKSIEIIKSIFGKPSEPDTKGKLYTKIKKLKNGKFGAFVKFSFFSRWRRIGWRFFDEQPGKGFTQSRAALYNGAYDDSVIGCQGLIENYKKYRGSGITIW